LFALCDDGAILKWDGHSWMFLLPIITAAEATPKPKQRSSGRKGTKRADLD
jgi:hypothetical protein